MRRLLGVAGAVAATMFGIGGMALAFESRSLVRQAGQVPSPVASPGGAQSLQIEMGEYYFAPSEISLQPGTVTVLLQNQGTRQHTLNVRTLADDADLFVSERVNRGESVSVSFELPAAGTYRIYCSLSGHADRGQVGTITAASVVSPVPAASPPPLASPVVPRPAAAEPLGGKIPLTLFALWIHIPVVVFWIGLVLLDIFVSLAPGLQDGQRAQMIGWFRPAILVAILAIMATGIWQTMDNPFHPVRGYADLGELRTTTYGLSLFLKHIFVVATFGLTLLVHFVVAPRLARAHAAGAETGHLRQAVTWLSVLNGFACLATLLAATRMVWELH